MARAAAKKCRYPVDLHMHSTCSDGELSPTQLVSMAKRRGLSAIAITDHDSVGGYEEAHKAAEGSNLTVITGTEISADFTREIHILGYFIDPSEAVLKLELERQAQIRENRVHEICGRLAKLNIVIDADEILKTVKGNVGRPHIARVLVKQRHVPSFNAAFQKYLGRHAPAYVDVERVSAERAIDLIHGAGGIAVLAHPGVERLESKLYALKEMGLDGLEVNHPAHKKSIRTALRAHATRLGLLISGGSDMHGHRSTCKIGDLGISEAEFQAMHQRANRHRARVSMNEYAP